MKYHEIGRTGMKVSELSFGASSLGGVFRNISESVAIDAVHTAIECGMNFIDVSPYYGRTKAETVLGKALRDIPREKYYLSTKVGRYGENGVNTWDYSAKRAVQSVEESMERLGIDYIDLINVHDIEFADLSLVVNETLPALVELRSKGGGPCGHNRPTARKPQMGRGKHSRRHCGEHIKLLPPHAERRQASRLSRFLRIKRRRCDQWTASASDRFPTADAISWVKSARCCRRS